MIRVTVPRPAADALMPVKCANPYCDKGVIRRDDGRGVGYCSICHGSGVLPPVLRLLVVEGEIEFEPWRHCTTGCEATGRCPVCERSYPPAGRSVAPEAHGSYCEPECDGWDEDRRRSKHLWPGELARLDRQVPVAIVRAIEAGERIGIDVECETCEGDGFRPVEDRLPGNHNYEQWKCPACNTKGVVPVGSVRPVRVLPVREGLASHIDTPVGQWLSVWRRDLRLDPPGYEWVAAIQSCDGHHIRTRPIDAAPLGVYGSAESLVGKFAVEVEDARREP